MYHVTVGISEKEYDAFAIASSQTNLLHSSKWAQVKSNWQNESHFRNHPTTFSSEHLYQSKYRRKLSKTH